MLGGDQGVARRPGGRPHITSGLVEIAAGLVEMAGGLMEMAAGLVEMAAGLMEIAAGLAEVASGCDENQDAVHQGTGEKRDECPGKHLFATRLGLDQFLDGGDELADGFHALVAVLAVAHRNAVGLRFPIADDQHVGSLL